MGLKACGDGDGLASGAKELAPFLRLTCSMLHAPCCRPATLPFVCTLLLLVCVLVTDYDLLKSQMRYLGEACMALVNGAAFVIFWTLSQKLSRCAPLSHSRPSSSILHPLTSDVTHSQILRPAGEPHALTHLSVHSGFLSNPNGLRGLRIGIDASIWFYHAQYGREGENPELRTLFFRCARLMRSPFLPLFVFDGPLRPKLKRKKKVGGKDHWLVTGMCEIIEAFGFEWRVAPGEAEAELAYLNRVGVLDAIVTDDVDTFVFGARVVIRKCVSTSVVAARIKLTLDT